VADIFFSYSSRDRAQVVAVRDALVALGFDVFWDQETPTGKDWDTWIRGQLQMAKCALVFWSANSIGSNNVRHEASVARQHGKLVPVMLEQLTVEQFPMGFYSIQGADLSEWTGEAAHPQWKKLLVELEKKFSPPLWIRNKLETMEAELMSERTQRSSAERRAESWRKQIAKEIGKQQSLQQERDDALAELESVKSRLRVSQQKGSKREATIAELSQKLDEHEEQRKRLVLEHTAKIEEQRQRLVKEHEAMVEAQRQRLVNEHAQATQELAALKLRLSEMESEQNHKAHSWRVTPSQHEDEPPQRTRTDICGPLRCLGRSR
jgi:hypothetical protein